MAKSFWEKVGGVAQYITDPKQILTAAGFALGGPVGAGLGRAVGGAVPDWHGKRESTLADGAQFADLGSAGKDFASGYAAGTIGQQVPGVKNLEGAFSGGANVAAMGPGTVQANAQNLGTPQASPGMGDPIDQWFGDVSSVGPPPSGVAQQPAGSMVGDSAFPSFDYFGGGGGDLTMPGQPAVSYADPMPQAFGGQPGMGAEAMGMNNPDFMSAPSFAPNFAPSPQTPAQTALERAQIGDEVQKGGGFFSGMNGLEKMYAINMAANLGSSMFAGPQSIGAGGMEMLGQQGLFSRAPQRQIGSFDDWISKRGTYAG